jgi:hypothetical protein
MYSSLVYTAYFSQDQQDKMAAYVPDLMKHFITLKIYLLYVADNLNTVM